MMLGVPSCAREKHSKENRMNAKRVFTIVTRGVGGNVHGYAASVTEPFVS